MTPATAAGDVLSGERDWAASLPNARLLLLERAGHFPYLEAPDRFHPAIDAFLAGGWPTALCLSQHPDPQEYDCHRTA
jgi:hypothetical protein